MRNILKLDSPNDYARFVDAPVLHPLISIIHYDELAPFRHSLNNYGVYGLFIQRQFPFNLSYGMRKLQVFPLNLSYGMRKLQVSDGSIIAVEPGQIGGLEDNGERISLCGWVLLWSPELLHGSELERQIDRYQFSVLLVFLRRFAAHGSRRVALHHAVGGSDATRVAGA